MTYRNFSMVSYVLSFLMIQDSKVLFQGHHCHRSHRRVVFCKIQVRWWSCQSYPIRGCFQVYKKAQKTEGPRAYALYMGRSAWAEWPTFLPSQLQNLLTYETIIQCGPSMTFWKIDILFAKQIPFCKIRYLSGHKDIYLPKRISISQNGIDGRHCI